MTFGKQFIGKELFAECTLSGTRQSLCRVLIWHSAKKSRRDSECHRDGGFVECQGQALGKGHLFAERRWLRHSAKVATMPSAPARHSANRRPLLSAWPMALGKSMMFAECNGLCTRQNMFPGSHFAECHGHCTRQSDWKQPFLFVFYIPSK